LCSFYTKKDGKVIFCDRLGQEVQNRAQSGAVEMLTDLLAYQPQSNFRINIPGLKGHAKTLAETLATIEDQSQKERELFVSSMK
jgi:hypothetical protein